MTTSSWRSATLGPFLLAILAASGCGDDSSDDPPASGGSAGTAGAAGQAGAGAGGMGGAACPTSDTRFDEGDATGHTDPYGARAASQARAGRLTDAGMIVQPAHGRQRINVGDYVLANDKIAVTIEDKGLSDGYARFGGEILAIDGVGSDGRPAGKSNYVESLFAMSKEMINPRSVSVINDGSDGQAAVIRVAGKLEAIPFLNGALAAVFMREYGVEAAFDYVLEPGSEKLLVKMGVINPNSEPIEFSFDNVTDEMYGFFQYNHNQLVTPGFGFADPTGGVENDLAGFISGDWNFALRPAGGEKLEYALSVSGFQYFTGPGYVAPPCSIQWVDHFELIGGGPEYDGLREAVRRVDGAPPWREISGSVKDAAGAGVAGAWIHELDDTGKYLSRTTSKSDGSFSIHAPPGAAVKLVPQLRGYPIPTPVDVASASSTADLNFAATGKIHVVATEQGTNTALPVRVQVIPNGGAQTFPAEYGVDDEANGRLHQDFAVTGDTTLVVPPGDHRVIVSRGYEWELSDQTVTVNANETVNVNVALEHSVDTSEYMCADFHIHSFMSADSNDPVLHKVKGALADGLDIPVSSEHEWVIDFQPIIQSLGLEDWAFGMPSEELTTFTWGHFGVVPLTPKPDQVNNGAVEWIGKKPPEMFDNVQTLPENPFFIVNHPSGSGFGGYFSSSRLDRATGVGTADLWSSNFDAIEVFNDSDFESNRDKAVGDWFALLNHGGTYWAVGSSDSHHIRTSPVGYPRTCIQFGFDDPKQLTAGMVRDRLAVGASTISGGLYMTVAGPNGEIPGATISGAGTSANFVITVQTPSWLNATSLEVIVNGVTQSTEALMPMGAGTAKRYVNNVTVQLDPNVTRNWVVFHAKSDVDLAPLHPGRKPFAVSNPIFFQ